MYKNKYILSVQPNNQPKKYPKPSFVDKKDLQKALVKKGLNIVLGEALKGGFVSQVYEAKLDGKDVVVKHTENLIPFDPTEFFISKEGQNIDAKILQLLAKSNIVRVPQVLYHFPEITTTVMEDLRAKGYGLMHQQLLRGQLPQSSATKIGSALSELAKISRSWKLFETNESAEQSIYERGLELRLAYPNSQKEYHVLEKEFVSNNLYWVWPDGHPKNIFVNKSGEVAFIDFGRSCWGDQRYMLPNFLAHIVIYTLAGCLNNRQAKDFILDSVSAHDKLGPVNELLFCQYLAMEVLHRANGKWIEGVNGFKQKIKLHEFGLRVFDERISTISRLIDLLQSF